LADVKNKAWSEKNPIDAFIAARETERQVPCQPRAGGRPRQRAGLRRPQLSTRRRTAADAGPNVDAFPQGTKSATAYEKQAPDRRFWPFAPPLRPSVMDMPLLGSTSGKR